MKAGLLLLACGVLFIGGCGLWIFHPPLPGDGVPTPGPPPGEPQPVQRDAVLGPFRLTGRDRNLDVKPLAHFSTRALTLSVEPYLLDNSAPLSPVDYCIAWGGLTPAKVRKFMTISQDHRWCNWRLAEEFPYDEAYVVRNSANIHILPSSPALDRAARRVRRGDWIEIEGELVEINGDLKDMEGFNWRSSTSREDTAGGACEVLWLTRLHYRDREWKNEAPSKAE